MADTERNGASHNREVGLTNTQFLNAVDIIFHPDLQKRKGGPEFSNRQVLDSAKFFFSPEHQRRIEEAGLSNEQILKAIETIESLFEDESINVYERIKEEKKLSFSDLADELGITLTSLQQKQMSTISLLEGRESIPDILRILLR
jgi:hypothetical protein